MFRPLGGMELSVGGAHGVLFSTTLLSSKLAVTRAAATRGSPGIVCVVTSSLKVNSLKYCNRHRVGAPGVSKVTRGKVGFVRRCSNSAIDTPSHYTLVAKGRVKRTTVEKGTGITNSSKLLCRAPLPTNRIAMTSVFGAGGCIAKYMNG